MNITVTTTLTHNHNGTPKIVAKCNGKQKTTNYDHGKSHDRNHGEAAGNLLISGKFDGLLISLNESDLDRMTHTTENGAKHVFTI